MNTTVYSTQCSDTLFYAGGYVGHDITAEVLRYDASTDQWVRTGDMQEARVDHAVSVVNMLDIMPYCQG